MPWGKNLEKKAMRAGQLELEQLRRNKYGKSFYGVVGREVDIII